MTRTLKLIAFSVFCAGLAAPAYAAVDYFLKIDGIEGESQDPVHLGEIEVLSWSWGETNDSLMRSQIAAGKRPFAPLTTEFSFTKITDSVSPDLALHCATGRHIDEVVLTARKADSSGEEYLFIRLKHVLITSYQTGGSSGDVIPVDTLSLNFEEIEWKYRRQDDSNRQGESVEYEWSSLNSKRVR